MRSSPARLLSFATLVPALFLFVVVPGCAKQSEGERCGEELGPNSDVCSDGLSCTSGQLLVGGPGAGNRCCRSDGSVTDSRCELSGNSPDTQSAAGSGNASAGSSNASAGSGGGAGTTAQSSDAGSGGN